MELPPWFKIDSLVRSLKLSNFLNTWFSVRKSNTVVGEMNINSINVNIFHLPKQKQPVEQEALNEYKEKDILQNNKTTEFKFTQEEMFLISKVNEVHALCGKDDFDFANDYGLALRYIRYRRPDDGWYYAAAVHISQAVQDIDFFAAFEIGEKPEDIAIFVELKSNIKYIYNRVIQELRHTDKRGRLKIQFNTPYHTALNKMPKITEEQYEEVFNEFQKLLIQLFQKFELKSII